MPIGVRASNAKALLAAIQDVMAAFEDYENGEKEPERARLLSVLQAYADKPRPTSWEHLLKDEGVPHAP
jgi:hypothetical protein